MDEQKDREDTSDGIGGGLLSYIKKNTYGTSAEAGF
jgi:hypothetical protein